MKSTGLLSKLKKTIKRTLLKRRISPEAKSRKNALVVYENTLLNIYKDVVHGIGKEILFGNSYEPEIGILMKHIVKPNDTVLDIGANIGIHSLLLSKLVGEEGKIFAFEPIPYIRNRLHCNKVLNSANNIEIIDCAIGDRNDLVEIIQVQETSKFIGSSSLVKNEVLSRNVLQEKTEKIKIQMITLDHFIQQRNLQHIDFIKMDIEGYEYFALLGAKQLLEDPPIMIMEYRSKRIDYLGLTNAQFKELLDDKYDCYEICPQAEATYPSLEPFHFDREVAENILCVPKYKSMALGLF